MMPDRDWSHIEPEKILGRAPPVVAILVVILLRPRCDARET
jgi:hypothetical protein